MAPTLQKSTRIAYLDGLRGLGALLVVMGHMGMLSGTPKFWIPLKLGPLDHIDLLFFMAGGDVRVSLFLVLSGFFLYLPFVNRRAAGATMTLAEFARRRARRILPAYYAAVALSLAIPTAAYYLSAGLKFFRGAPITPLSWEPMPSVITHLLIAQGISPEWFSSLNGPHWTLTLEIQLYIVFPLLVWCIEKFHISKVVIFSILASAAYRIWAHENFGSLLVNPMDEYSINYYLISRQIFIGRLSEFVLGMLAVSLVRRGDVTIKFWSLPLLALLISLSFFVTNHLGIIYGLSDLLWGVTFFFLVICCAGSKLLNTIFSLRPLSWIGKISYSIYLIHFPLLYIYFRIVRHTGLFEGNMAFILMLTGWPFLLIAAYAFYNLFEKPFLNSQKPISGNAVI